MASGCGKEGRGLFGEVEEVLEQPCLLPGARKGMGIVGSVCHRSAACRIRQVVTQYMRGEDVEVAVYECLDGG